MSVKVVEVEKTYSLGENKVHALKGINLELNRGEFVGFYGSFRLRQNNPSKPDRRDG